MSKKKWRIKEIKESHNLQRFIQDVLLFIKGEEGVIGIGMSWGVTSDLTRW